MICADSLRECYRMLSPAEELAAWESGDRHVLIQSQLPWVHRIAIRIAARRKFADIDLLVSAGHIALIQCLDRFDPRISRLSTYCFRKVGWAMWSEIRNSYRGLSASSYLRRSRGVGKVQSWDDQTPSAECESEAESDAIRQEEAGLCRQAIAQLPDRERYVIEQRYFFHRTLKQVGEAMGVSGERVRQIDLRAKRKLVEMLGQVGVTE